MNGYFSQLLRQTGVRYSTAPTSDATGMKSLSAASATPPLDMNLEVGRLEPFSLRGETPLPGETQVGDQPSLDWERQPGNPQPPEQVVLVEPALDQKKAGHQDKPGNEGPGRPPAFWAGIGRNNEDPGPAAPHRTGSPSLANSPDDPALFQAGKAPAGPDQHVVPPLTLESDTSTGGRRIAPPGERDAPLEKPASSPRHQWQQAMEAARKWVAASSGAGEGAEDTGSGTILEASPGSMTPEFRGDSPVPARQHHEPDQGPEPQTREFHLSIGSISLTIEKPPDIRPEIRPLPTRGDRLTGGDAPRLPLTRHYLRIR